MKYDKGTLIRTLVLAVALINQILVVFGKSPLPIDEATINDIVIQLDILYATLFTVASGVWSWWKNNYVSSKGLKQKEVLSQHKLD